MRWIDDLGPDMERRVVALAQSAVEARPDNPGPRRALAAAYRKCGQPEAALAALDSALARFPDDAALLFSRAQAARMFGDFPAALAALDSILARNADAPAAQALRCEILLRLNDESGARAALTALGERASGFPALFETRLSLLRRAARFEEMLALCDGERARHPANASAVFHKAGVLLSLGRESEAAALLDQNDLVEIVELSAPEGFGDDAQFRDALASEILANPTLVPDPAAKSIRAGRQTRRLRQPGAAATEALLAQCRTEVERYAARLAALGHPYARQAPASARLNAWAVAYDKSGRQAVHHHGDGWLSGVFYVRAAQFAEGYDAPLLLGPLSISAGSTVRHAGVREIEPVPGRLVLFPSYMPHATVAARSGGSRIAVSFDVVPAGANSDFG